ncbi:alpha/beta hydrolase-fold protein [Paenibacillus sp. HB172176]|uniref:alpha/beta hydrolase n=1 Tax=Paenibacillus sp. HB172176 TaxID=2493690 RepID=UPI001439CF48|nr:alpha/beta hydrolase-fold protein [Paenibacillus sp. HB172176]
MRAGSRIVTITDFYGSKLDNARAIYIYLPPGYEEEGDKRYPALYMHAGQRAFKQTHPEGDSWRMDEACDRLIAEGLIEEIIIVAIAHVRPATANEFYHFQAPAEEAAEIACSGMAYEHFIIHELKPYIDNNYLTLRDAANTALMGASAGGLSTYHIGFRNPQCFGMLMLLSPYFIKASLDETSQTGLIEEKLYRDFSGRRPLRIWLDIGDAEGLFLPEHALRVADRLLDEGFQYRTDLAFLLEPEAAHEEEAWGRRVHLPLLYMFGKRSKPVSLELPGRTTVGLRGKSVRLNPIIRYENGLRMTAMDAVYHSDEPDVLDVGRDGCLVPKRTGVCRVRVMAEGLEVSREYEIVPELSPLVTVKVSARVASGQAPADAIYGGMGMRLVHTGGGRYSGQFLLPRDSGYQFRFTQGFRRFELDSEGRRMPNRHLRADRELELEYRIEGFSKPKTDEAERRNGRHAQF